MRSVDVPPMCSVGILPMFFFVIPAQAGIHFFLFLLFFTRSHGYPAYSRGVAMPPSQPVNQSTISGY